MNIKEILSENERILYVGQQKRLVPSGKEWLPGKIAVTDQRIILESTSMMGLKKSYEDLHYSDVESISFKKNVFSCEITLKSRFQGAISIHSIGKKDAENLERIINEYTSQYNYGRAITTIITTNWMASRGRDFGGNKKNGNDDDNGDYYDNGDS